MTKLNLIDRIAVLPAWAYRLAAARFQPRMQVKVTRKKLVVYFPTATAQGLHVIPRPGPSEMVHFSVKSSSDTTHHLAMTVANGKETILAAFESQAQANNALKRLNVALTSNVFMRWAVRLLVLWLIWFIATSTTGAAVPARASAQKDSPQAEFVLPAEPQAQAYPSAPAIAPSAASGSLADQIYAKAMEAQAQAQQQNTPPRVVDNTDGLDAFGLDAGGSNSGPGCNPKLAFTVPDQAIAK